MLEDLDSVDWSQLKLAGFENGPATEVPRYLRMIAAGESCEEAFDYLYEWVADSTEVSEAGLASIPFLLEIAFNGMPSNPCRGDLIYFFTLFLNPDEQDMIRLKAEKMVLRELPRLLELLDDPDPKVRLNTSYFLLFCHRDWERIEPVLIKKIGQEREPVVKVQHLFSLARFDPYGVPNRSSPAAATLLRSVMQDPNENPAIRFAAVLAGLFIEAVELNLSTLAFIWHFAEAYIDMTKSRELYSTWYGLVELALGSNPFTLAIICDKLATRSDTLASYGVTYLIAKILKTIRSEEDHAVRENYTSWAMKHLVRYLHNNDAVVRGSAMYSMYTECGDLGIQALNDFLLTLNDPSLPSISRVDDPRLDHELYDRLRHLVESYEPRSTGS